MLSLGAEDARLTLSLLDRLEQREAQFLTWGFINAAFSWKELERAADEVIGEGAGRSSELLQHLLDRKLLLDLPGRNGGREYRTRLAEGVRLFAQLRQWFHGQQWWEGPELVADYRLAATPRRYPRRALPPADALAGWKGSLRAPVEAEVLQALLNPAHEVHLARFQYEATNLLLQSLGGDRDGGLMVCAGTGSGKTMAFYLPALARMCSQALPDQYWTQALAIYPRTELLKDQFTEACTQTRLLSKVLKRKGRRPLLIGALYGATPDKAETSVVDSWSGWTRRADGYICPMLRCPQCDGDLLWPKEQLARGREHLVCRTCGTEIDQTQLVLTRERLRNQPPDLLFTTTEMLNRHLSDPKFQRVFGVRQPPDRSPYVMLLDEIHSYGGVHGAHVALLLRRWRALVRRKVQYVGLSATLSDPLGFLAEMTAVPLSRLTLVESVDDLIEEGQEYQLLLRWNPASATQVMSTTIQTAMLMGRLLDQPGHLVSEGVFPPKVFLFTDNLDQTNRLYNNLQDAEGRDSYGRELANREPLAALRGRDEPAPTERLAAGQNWRVCEDFGHQPAERLQIGRTSSQDSGVAAEAQVIVATASLELGYNDRAVGAIIQHKAPMGAAAFLQRRGRAGRDRLTRPWTIVVLSDFGRDRQAYEAYEELFSPQIGRPPLPVNNRYVLKMQAVYTLIDWLSLQTHQPAWAALSGPPQGEYAEWARGAQEQILQKVQQLLDEPKVRQGFTDHLLRALRLDQEQLTAILWEPPRSLMMAVLPTLHRRLTTAWRRVPSEAGESLEDPWHSNAPLPDFIPPSLFTDLMVPEVVIRAAAHGEADPDRHYLTIVQALNTMAPGSVTRRFGFRHALASHWVPPPLSETGSADLPVSQFCPEFEQIGVFQLAREGKPMSLPCLRPFSLDAQQVPQDIKPTSRSFLDWDSQLFSSLPGEAQGLPPGGPLDDLLKGVRFFTHVHNQPLTVRRFASGARASVRYTDGSERDCRVRFVQGQKGEPVALGFEQEVDAIAFDCAVTSELAAHVLQGPGLVQCRRPYFQHLVLTNELIGSRANHFQALLLADVALAALLEHALSSDITVAEAADWFATAGAAPGTAAERLLPVAAHQGDGTEEEPSEGAEEETEQRASRGAAAVREMLNDAGVRAELAALARWLYADPDQEFIEWTRCRLRETLAGALLRACYQLAGSAEDGDLLLDVDSGIPPPGVALAEGAQPIWVSESVVGGTGVIESLLQRYSEDPRRFLSLVEAALAPSDLELVDEQLLLALTRAADTEEVAQAYDSARRGGGEQSLQQVVQHLTSRLSAAGCDVSPLLLRSLAMRVLRPGSSPASDELLLVAARRWQAAEQRLGLEIDQRVFCLLAAGDTDLSALVEAAVEHLAAEGDWEMVDPPAVLSALMWPRGASLCARTLAHHNPFRQQVGTDPRLIREELAGRRRYLDLTADDWRSEADRELRETGSLYLRCPRDQRKRLAQAIVNLTAVPVELDYLRSYPTLSRLDLNTESYVATLHLREALL